MRLAVFLLCGWLGMYVPAGAEDTPQPTKRASTDTENTGETASVNQPRPILELLEEANQAGFDDEDFSRALELYEKILERRPDYHTALVGKGFMLARKGEPEQALAVFNQTLEEWKDSNAARFGRAQVLVTLERHDEAIQIFRSLLEKSPPTASIYNGIAWACAASGRYHESQEALALAAALDPEDPYHLQTRAWALLLADDPAKSIELAKQTLQTPMLEQATPEDVNYSYLVLALAYYQRGQANAAQGVLDMALEEGNRDVWSYQPILFLSAKITGEELADAADNEAQQTEAACYRALAAHYAGDRKTALRFRSWLVDHGVKKVWEYLVALEHIPPEKQPEAP